MTVVCASFLFVGDLNLHHELLGSTTTDSHGDAALISLRDCLWL